MKLTKRSVEGLAPNSFAWDGAVIGFAARRQRSEAINYVLRYRLNGAQRWISIGRHGSPWTVEQARREAQRLLGQVVGGSDPKGPSSAELFGVEVERYLERKRPSMKPGSFIATQRHLMTHAKPLHRLRLTEIDRRTIALRLAEIEADCGPIARNRTRASLSAFYSWCIREGLVETNPVEGTGKADERSRERVLTPKEIGKLWTTLVAGQHVHFVDIVHLLLLTGQRRNEIGGLRVSEIDFDNRCLRLPPERTKNKREHIVPLSKPALSILRRALVDVTAEGSLDRSYDARVFAGFSWSIEKAKLDAGLGPAPWRIHDIRRSVATHMAEIGVLPHIVEAILNHVSGHKAGVAGTYNRAKYLDEARDALDRWAKWIEANAEGA
jgi:integrase